MQPSLRWRTVLVTVVVAYGLVILGGFADIYSGVYDIGATKPHWPPTQWMLQTVRDRSIKAHAAGVKVPAGLGDRDKLVIGAGHFAAHCAVCHGAPGVPEGDIGQGLYPQPPDLAHVATHRTPAEMFWISSTASR